LNDWGLLRVVRFKKCLENRAFAALSGGKEETAILSKSKKDSEVRIIVLRF
jgi:hypothetical protein